VAAAAAPASGRADSILRVRVDASAQCRLLLLVRVALREVMHPVASVHRQHPRRQLRRRQQRRGSSNIQQHIMQQHSTQQRRQQLQQAAAQHIIVESLHPFS